jgi:hypothetical protein
MSQLLTFTGSVRRDRAVDRWMREHEGELGTIAKRWFEVMRSCGNDVRELLHDGHPTACVEDAAFGYVNAFRAHVNVGFFRGAELADPKGLLEGTGRFMRHVKLRPAEDVDARALRELIHAAYVDIKRRLEAEILGGARWRGSVRRDPSGSSRRAGRSCDARSASATVSGAEKRG